MMTVALMTKFPFANVELMFPDHFDTRDDNHVRSQESMDYDRSPASFAACIGVTPAGLLRMRQRGWVSASWADKIAVANGMHPSSIWPAEWREHLDNVLEAEELERENTRRRTAEWRAREANKLDEAERMPY